MSTTSPPVIDLRLAVPGDCSALMSVVQAAYRGGAVRGWTDEADVLDGPRTDAESLHTVIADPIHSIIVAEREGVILGCVQVTDGADGAAHLSMLSVDPGRQAGGIGRLLARAAERHASETLGHELMVLEVIARRTELVAWYERLGYRRTGSERPFEPAAPHLGTPRNPGLTFVELTTRLRPEPSGTAEDRP